MPHHHTKTIDPIQPDPIPLFDAILQELEGAYASNTLLGYRKDLKRFAQFCKLNRIDAEHLGVDDYVAYLSDTTDVLGMSSIRRAQQQAKPLTHAIIQDLLHHIDPTTVTGLRDTVLLHLGYETMRRRSELIRFRFSDLRQSAQGQQGLWLRLAQ